MNILEEARHILKLEIEAMEATSRSLDAHFEKILALIEKTHNAARKIVFLGMGKNVFVARKVAATFNSTGVSSIFLDPVSALHGDVGVCKEGDLALLYSNSGESPEMVTAVPALKRLGVTTVCVSRDATSALAQACDHVLSYSVPAEACPLNLAPTASTTAAMALGDALAMVFLKKRGFGPEEFAKFHPSGTLGRTLLLKVTDVMRDRSRLAVINSSATVLEALNAITERKTGLAVVVDDAGRMVGVFSDGDFRRLVLKNKNPLAEKVLPYITRQPKTIQQGMLAVEALRRFEESRINQLVVLDEFEFPVGLVEAQDLPKLKLV
jgi:arabinose-5-phosphate isomerase